VTYKGDQVDLNWIGRGGAGEPAVTPEPVSRSRAMPPERISQADVIVTTSCSDGENFTSPGHLREPF
jgi:hypothetical protein